MLFFDQKHLSILRCSIFGGGARLMISMTRLSHTWATSLLYALSVSSAALGQSSTSASVNSADGLQSASVTSSASPTVGTSLVNGTSVTYSVQYTVPAAADVGQNILPNIKDPNATDAQTVCPGYTASNVKRTGNGFTATLTLAGEACNVYGTDVNVLNLTVGYQSAHRLGINISPAYLSAENITQFILPESLVELPKNDGNATTKDSDLQFSWSNEPSFSFTVLRKSTGDVIFSTKDTVLVYENQFIEFVSTLPENYNLYGMGERIHGLRLGNNFTATFYAADVGDPIDTNLYGNHPFYLDTRYYEVSATSGNLTLLTGNTIDNATYVSYSHGAYLRNSHGMEALMQPNNITWRTLGGSIDLYFFDGPTAADVTKQYQIGAVGLPAAQQYWTFGYHQCRWGYKNWTEVEDVVNNFAAFGIPLETIWNDIDYMFQYRDFLQNNDTFGYEEGEAFLAKLHANNQHYTTIIDSAIYIPNPDNASDAYSVYTDGHERDVFMKNPAGTEYIGEVWPGYTVFPDWIAPEAVSWWTDSFVEWHKKIPTDGVWIDMSEVSSFCVGSCGTYNLSLNPVHPGFSLPGEPGDVIYGYPEGFNITNATEAAAASSSSSVQAASAAATASSSSTIPYLITTITPGVRNVNYPPYAINNVQGDLAVHAVSPNATHSDGTEEYDVHNLFGYQILNATYQALLAAIPEKRPFIIGRSTFAGAGKWAGHWGGDNESLFAYMFFSIPQALNFALFGIPIFGVDTCGFNGNSDEELCNRWMQLSAFFPFYRNHNTLSANPQEPYVWESVIEASKTAMAIRYSLLPYIYTLSHLSHTTGSTIMRALAWEFPDDPTLAAADRQFLLGPSLMITPVLKQGATTVDGVFPGVTAGELWYDWYNQSAVEVQARVNTTIDAPLGHIPVYVRGGTVLPRQEPALTTTEVRNSPWSLLVALNAEGAATGVLYIDDGESLVQNATLLVDFTAAQDSLYASARGLYQDTNALANVTILGVQRQPGNVTLNGVKISSGVDYNSTSKVLAVTGLQNATSSSAWAQDWVLSW
ncbi:glycosyl hydrolases family 31-domain-containing protein [Delphinella strobiligena]|nr:glycosyl hydrolases family 31-domain-containing protein [Delphinella strobiligena]